ncbi:MAG: YafY family transcriptional regulator, partial [Spirochaetes bacterium]|nr:YafY family transcriptional regulator [Spirochaetota bacterium]
MKAERLFSILNILLSEKRISAPELAKRFEVSVRTIYRDLDALSAEGVPVVASAGYGGGFELTPGFSIDRSFLKHNELRELVGTLRGFEEALKDPLLSGSLGKLAGLAAAASPSACPRRPGRLLLRPEPSETTGIPDTSEPSLAKLPPPLMVCLTPWGGPSPDAALVELLRQAIDDCRPVRLVYQDMQGQGSQRSIEPFTIVLGGPVWYVHAWCRLRQSFRLFRLSRIAEAALEAGGFDPQAHGSPPHPFLSTPEAQLINISLEAPAAASSQLRELFGHMDLQSLPDGRIRCSFLFP